MASTSPDPGPAAAGPISFHPRDTPGARVDLVLQQFRAAGGRVTTARRAIVRTLLGGSVHEHLTADEISSRVQLTNPDVAVSTVYRSLDALEALGVVEHVHIGHGPTVYHLAGEAHIHLVCRRCSAVLEMPVSTLQVMRDEIRERHGFAIEPRHFAINGVCSACGDPSPSEKPGRP